MIAIYIFALIYAAAFGFFLRDGMERAKDDPQLPRKMDKILLPVLYAAVAPVLMPIYMLGK